MANEEQNVEQGQEVKSDLDRRYDLAVDELKERLEAEGVELVRVRYEGEGNVSNLDIAPYNIVVDEQSDYVGRSAIINPGDEFDLPKELAASCFLTYGFVPAGDGDEGEEIAHDPDKALVDMGVKGDLPEVSEPQKEGKPEEESKEQSEESADEEKNDQEEDK